MAGKLCPNCNELTFLRQQAIIENVVNVDMR